MKTYISNLIPRLQEFSKKLDDLTRLTNQHWVVVDEISHSKNVYIFRTNNELLISRDGKVERGSWEYLGNNSLLIDIKEESYLFKRGFLDKNVLALKVDNKDEYAILVNENKYDGELNSIQKIENFLTKTYLEPVVIHRLKEFVPSPLASTPVKNKIQIKDTFKKVWQDTDKGKLEIRTKLSVGYTHRDLVFLKGEPAPDGIYIYGWPSWMNSLVVKDGKLKKL